ncbi:MAG: hypothetical protein SFU56_00040 [Capsulimonadales bacterium]|nr:hypothetical protein [Capsulimonadales bacterium]
MATTIIKQGQPGSKAWFKDSFLLHKLHSLSGVMPIGFFMIFHLTANSYSLRGATEFNTAVKAISYAPFVILLEIFVIAIPILFHAIYGIFIAMEMQGPGGNTSYYGYQRNWLYVLQRWSGVVAFAYILWHTWDTTFFKYGYELTQGEAGHELGFRAISYDAMAWRMAQPWYLAMQITGVTAAAFHLGNGVLNFAIRWGIAIGRDAQRIAAGIGWLLGLGLTGLGVLIAVNFAINGQKLHQTYPTLDSLIRTQIEQQKAVSQTPSSSSHTVVRAN